MIKRNMMAFLAGITLFLTNAAQVEAHNENNSQPEEDTATIEEISFDIKDYVNEGYLEKDIYNDNGEHMGTISIEHIEEEELNNDDEFELFKENNFLIEPYSIDYGNISFRAGGINRVRYSNFLRSIGYDLTISPGPTRITKIANPVYNWTGWTVNRHSLTHGQRTANLTLFGNSLISSGTFSLNSRLSNGRIFIDID